MAEIHVERKRGGGKGIWLLLLLVVLVAVAVWAWQAGYINLGMLVHDADTQSLAALNAGGSNGA